MSLDVGLGGISSVVSCMGVVPVGHMGVMRRLLVVAGCMMFGGFPVMTGSVLMVLGCFRVVIGCFFRH